MNLLRNAEGFDLITTLELYPDYENVEYYAQELRKAGLIKESNEILNISRDTFNELLEGYNYYRKQTIN